jgi:DNA ligase-1
MTIAFEALAELCEKLEGITRRIPAVNLVADFLKNLEPEEVEPAVSMILGRPFPKRSQQTLDVSWATLSEIVRRITGIERKVFLEAFDKTGDIGSATKIVFESYKVRRQAVLFEKPLTIMEVKRSFEAIAEAVGSGSRERKERLIETLLSSASPLEVKYLVKIFIGEMRTGFHEGLMEQAISKAFQIPLENVKRASMVLGDIGTVAALIKAEGKEALSKIDFKIFRPVKLMLAQMTNDVAEAARARENGL